MGPCTFYSLEEDADGKRTFVALTPEEEAGADFLARKEIVFVQSLALECYPDAKSICTDLHAGPGQLVLGDYRGDKIDATVLVEDGDVRFFNFHERGVHYEGHLDYYRREAEEEDAIPPGVSDTCRSTVEERNKKKTPFHVFEETRRKDAIKLAYCESVNQTVARAFGYDFRFTYGATFECQVFCSGSPESRLRRSFPKRYLRAFPKRISYESALDELLNGKTMGGFVVIKGGMDGKDTGSPTDNLFGYCVTKAMPRAEEIGPYSSAQIRKYGQDPAEYCRRSVITTPRLNFLPDNLEVVSVQYLRWLVEKRALKDFTVVHVAAYNELPALRPFLEALLQKRWELKKRGGGTELESLTAKQFVNSFYGYASIFGPRFPVTRIKTESNICRTGLSADVLNVTCMGHRPITPRGRAKRARAGDPIRRGCRHLDKDDCELVFSVTEKNTDSKIDNVAQISGSILGVSKVIFFDKINALLEMMDPRYFQVCYLDTGKPRNENKLFPAHSFFFFFFFPQIL